jgi:HTH-type transcriptional regulator/antitoxin HigA
MATNATWTKHPGYYIREEMEARGWLQRDLAFIMGVPEQSVNLIVGEKKGISPDMAQLLGAAFDVPGEFFANLQQAYDLANAKQPDAAVAVRRGMQSVFPVREMMKRGWIQQSDTPMLESQLTRFFEATSSGEIPYLAHAAKKTRHETREIPPAQLAWLFRVRHIAKSVAAPAYSEKGLRNALKAFEALMVAPEEARHVPRALAECGVRFVLVEKLPGAEIDGVCFWIGNSPVIGMSMRRDKIDNFWFVLRHEIEHVLRGDGRKDEVIDILDEQPADDLPEEERIANEVAGDFCANAQKVDSFMKRKHPFYYEKDVIALARLLQRHPGLVVGQMQKRMKRHDWLVRHTVKIRSFVLPGAITDGWGQVVPVEI